MSGRRRTGIVVFATMVVVGVSACVAPTPSPTSSWAEVCTPVDIAWDRLDVTFGEVPAGAWLFSSGFGLSGSDIVSDERSFTDPVVGQTVSITPASRGRCVHLQGVRGLTYQVTPVPTLWTSESNRWGWAAGSPGPYPTPYVGAPPSVDVSGLTAATNVAANGWHTCAEVAGAVECWGRNIEGQLGDGTLISRATPAPVAGLSGIDSVALGDRFSCALSTGGSVWCWGDNGDGQLGDGTTTDSPVPVQVDGLSDAVQLSANGQHACAVRAGGSAVCWGYDSAFVFGNGSTNEQHTTPVPATGLTGVTHLSTGTTHACAVVGTGAVKCWGYGSLGETGDGTATTSPVPVDVVGVTDATSVEVGSDHTCALRSNGAVSCWGGGARGQMGNGTALTANPLPLPVPDVVGAVELGSGRYYSCARIATGGVRCWGSGTRTAGFLVWNVPVDVPTVSAATALTVGDHHACVIQGAGTVRCWGDNESGQLGHPD